MVTCLGFYFYLCILVVVCECALEHISLFVPWCKARQGTAEKTMTSMGKKIELSSENESVSLVHDNSIIGGIEIDTNTHLISRNKNKRISE